MKASCSLVMLKDSRYYSVALCTCLSVCLSVCVADAKQLKVPLCLTLYLSVCLEVTYRQPVLWYRMKSFDRSNKSISGTKIRSLALIASYLYRDLTEAEPVTSTNVLRLNWTSLVTIVTETGLVWSLIVCVVFLCQTSVKVSNLCTNWNVVSRYLLVISGDLGSISQCFHEGS